MRRMGTYVSMALQTSIKGDGDAIKNKGGWGAQGGGRSASPRNAFRGNISISTRYLRMLGGRGGGSVDDDGTGGNALPGNLSVNGSA